MDEQNDIESIVKEVQIKSCENKFIGIRNNSTHLIEEYQNLSKKFSDNYISTFFDLINDIDYPLTKACEAYVEIF